MSEHRTFGFSADQHRSPGSGREWLSDDDFHDREDRLDQAMALVGPAEAWARDLLQVARAAFLVDKRYRRQTKDGWTRTIDLTVEVAEPDRWGAAQLDVLMSLLATLTGDTWTVQVVGGAAHRQWLDYDERVAEVALFSGGLDSTSYAAQAAVRAGSGRLLLIGYDDNIHARQKAIAQSIHRIRHRPVQLIQLGQRALSAAGAGSLERSSRTRGFLYMATAVAAASAHHVDEIKVPENGQLAVNPPLSPSRLGALSTRSVHPWTLDRMNRLIRGLGGSVAVVNPLLPYTKGEVCKQLLGAGLTRNDLEFTVSCGDPSSGRYHAGVLNCGYCFPCLVRRSGILFAAGVDETIYRRQLTSFDAKSEAASNLRALIRWLSTNFGLRDLVADMPFPISTPLPTVLPMLHRGRQELATMVEQLVSADSPLRHTWSARLTA